MTAAAPRRIAVVSGGRADYGLLRPVMAAIRAAPDLDLQLLLTGAHFSARHGATARVAAEDGFPVAAEVDIGLDGDADTPVAVTRAVGRATIGFADAFERLRPDLVLVLGDRYEILAAAQAAALARIPLAHLHGGEITEGAVDEYIRHAVTKLAQLHFVSTPEHGRRVVQMGEDPDRVFVTGAPGLDEIARLRPLDRAAFEAALPGWRFGPVNLIVTFHPETLSGADPAAQVDELLAGLDTLPQAHVLVTGVNADAGNRAVAARMEAWVALRPGRAVMVASLGQARYLSALALMDAVVGNSSSGLIEAPSFRLPTVNVGDRQGGRLRAASVIDCPCRRAAVAAALARALDPAFRAGLAGLVNPYGDGGAAPRIVSVLRNVGLAGLAVKRFRDLAVDVTLRSGW